MKLDASETKSKSEPEPKFMRVKLDASDASDDDAKAAKREEKIQAEREARKKRRMLSSSEEEVDLKNAGSQKPKNDTLSKLSKADSDQSDWSSDGGDGKKAKNKLDISSDSDIELAPAKRKRKLRKSSSSSSSSSDDTDSGEKDRPKAKKRKRIKKNSSSEGEDGGDDDDDDDDDANQSKGRKNIHRIISDKKVSVSTKEAAIDEKERRKRMEERQKKYNELFKITETDTISELPLDFDEKTKEVLVEVHPHLVKKLKPHQGGGIKFMWDAVFESKKDVLADKVPGGAILAHCMGLGKTLQTISLVHTVMTAFPEQIHRVMVICPVNTIKNWDEEFNKWLKGPVADDFEVYEMSGEKDNWGRADRLDMWRREGGVMIMGYDMFRNLTNDKNKQFKRKQRDIFRQTLLDPGPQLVVCDEGHILKNTKSALNAAMNRITTRRRIILTGTPLQNNLNEYFAMVDFVKPKLLGTYKEFKNRFVNPIQNGQHSDSTDRDVRIMKKRSFILSDLLKGCMQRLDYNVLVPYLQPKHEYVLCICLTDFQKRLYTFYLENYARAGQIGSAGKLEGGKKGGLFYDVQNLSRIWNHPYILAMAKTRADLRNMMDDDDEEDEAGSLKDFINDDDDDEESTPSEEEDSDGSDEAVADKKPATRTKADKTDLMDGLEEAKANALAEDKGWWVQFMERSDDQKDMTDEDVLNRLEWGSKMVLLMDILKECEMMGDKVLVFSQSLLSLDLIEKFLTKMDHLHAKGGKGADDLESSFLGSWIHGQDYFRMDGSTSADIRKKWCNYFNKASNTRMRLFLISTKAGGLGINLVAANRVIIFDASWNPAHDVQSIFRVYRFGQTKPVYIYRFLAKGTMEEKIYDRQVTKQSLSARVVDEQQIERHFSMNELAELYEFKDEPMSERPLPKVPKDLLLAELIKKHPRLIWKFHDHDSLLENQVDENLTEEERKAAWEEFENEKKGISNLANSNMINHNLAMANIDPSAIQNQYRMQYPHLSEEQVVQATRAYIMQITSGLTRRPAYDKSHYQQEMARARQQQQQLYPGMYNNRNNARTPSQQTSREELASEAERAQQLQEYARLRLAASQNASLNVDQYREKLLQLQQLQYQKRLAAATAAVATPQPRLRQPEPTQTITLDDDDSEIVIEGTPETRPYVPPKATPSPGKSRRGRPRLDPDTDIY